MSTLALTDPFVTTRLYIICAKHDYGLMLISYRFYTLTAFPSANDQSAASLTFLPKDLSSASL